MAGELLVLEEDNMMQITDVQSKCFNSSSLYDCILDVFVFDTVPFSEENKNKFALKIKPIGLELSFRQSFL